ncbi:MAG: hypothetical protein WAR01_07595 [Dokdonella sp.]|uniref:hypothetical protein n=1 Tax=Dokdonella sp. TaxID=2291710 RepID=UPI003BAE9898
MAAGFYPELLVPLRASVPQTRSNSIRYCVNPDIGAVGHPSADLLVNTDVLLRMPFEDNQLTLDICGISPPASGC